MQVTVVAAIVIVIVQFAEQRRIDFQQQAVAVSDGRPLAPDQGNHRHKAHLLPELDGARMKAVPVLLFQEVQRTGADQEEAVAAVAGAFPGTGAITSLNVWYISGLYARVTRSAGI